jgi:hypothetical protein
MWPDFASSFHLAQYAFERFHRNLAPVLVEDFDEARHVRTLEVMRQVHVHVEAGDGVLHAYALVFHHHRVADALDADLVYGKVAHVMLALHVGNGVMF